MLVAVMVEDTWFAKPRAEPRVIKIIFLEIPLKTIYCSENHSFVDKSCTNNPYILLRYMLTY